MTVRIYFLGCEIPCFWNANQRLAGATKASVMLTVRVIVIYEDSRSSFFRPSIGVPPGRRLGYAGQVVTLAANRVIRPFGVRYTLRPRHGLRNTRSHAIQKPGRIDQYPLALRVGSIRQ